MTELMDAGVGVAAKFDQFVVTQAHSDKPRKAMVRVTKVLNCDIGRFSRRIARSSRESGRTSRMSGGFGDHTAV